MQKGTILSFRGSWSSGLGFLYIQDSVTKQIEAVPCENGPTVRALEGAFGNVMGEGHTVKMDGGHIGKEIYWDYDDLGVILEAFAPVDDAPDKVVKAYEFQHTQTL